MKTIKPGYKTSEFWFTLVSFIFSGLYLTGLITDHANKEDLIQETTRGLEALILIIGQLTVLYRYVKGRTEIKKTWWDTTEQKEEPKPEVKKKPKPKTKKEVTHDSSRTNKSRSRQANK